MYLVYFREKFHLFKEAKDENEALKALVNPIKPSLVGQKPEKVHICKMFNHLNTYYLEVFEDGFNKEWKHSTIGDAALFVEQSKGSYILNNIVKTSIEGVDYIQSFVVNVIGHNEETIFQNIETAKKHTWSGRAAEDFGVHEIDMLKAHEEIELARKRARMVKLS